jgi:uncharacterized protein YukE
MPAAAATGGGGDGPPRFSTDFAGEGAGGLLGLRAMIADAHPPGLDAVSANWTTVKKALLTAQSDLQKHTSAALENWEGDAADGFASRAGQLSESLGNGAEYAANASSGITAAADALRIAKNTIPTVPSELARLGRKLTGESDHAFKQDLSNGMSRAEAIKQAGGDLSLMEERHQQAIVVMQNLEDSYNTAAQMIGDPPADPVGTHGVYPPPPVTTKRSPVTGTDGTGVAGPRTVGGARLVKEDETGGDGPTQAPNPANPGSGTKVGDDGSGDGVSGGERTPAPPEPGTTLQGGGPVIGQSGDGGGLGPGATGASPVAGIGDGKPVEGGGEGSSGGFSVDVPIGAHGGRGASSAAGGEGVTEPGGTTVGSGAARGGSGAADAYAESDGMSQGGLLGAEESGRSGMGEGFIEGGSDPRVGGSVGENAEQGGPGMMGGLGAGNSQGRKRKRRARAHYLVEDEESWVFGRQANPPVIS